MNSENSNNSTQQTAGLLSGYYGLLMSDPRVRRALSPEDRAFFKGMGYFVSGALVLNDIRTDILKGTDP